MKEKFREYLVQNHYKEYTENGVPSKIDKYVRNIIQSVFIFLKAFYIPAEFCPYIF